MHAIERELKTARWFASCHGDEDAIDEAERELAALRAELSTLRTLAGKSLAARDKEANAEMTLENAKTNFHRFDAEARAYENALIEAIEADADLLKALIKPAGPGDQKHYDEIAANYNRERWKAIETAPKDGTHVLCREVYGGRRDTNQQNPPYVAHWFDSAWVLSNGDQDVPLEPTHWMALPLPPNVESEGAERLAAKLPLD